MFLQMKEWDSRRDVCRGTGSKSPNAGEAIDGWEGVGAGTGSLSARRRRTWEDRRERKREEAINMR